MSDFQSILKTFVWITLFAFVMVGFALQMAGNPFYGRDTTQFQDELGVSSINSTISSMNTNANQWKQVFFEQNIFNPLTVAGIIVTGMFNLAKTMFNFITLPFTLFSNIATNVLKIPAIIVNIMEVLIIISVIFGVWRLIKAGY